MKYADKEGEEDIEITKNQSKKLDFMTAKVRYGIFIMLFLM